MGVSHSMDKVQVDKVLTQFEATTDSIRSIETKMTRVSNYMDQMQDQRMEYTRQAEAATDVVDGLGETLSGRTAQSLDYFKDTFEHFAGLIESLEVTLYGMKLQDAPKQIQREFGPLLMPAVVLVIIVTVSNCYFGFLLANDEQLSAGFMEIRELDGSMDVTGASGLNILNLFAIGHVVLIGMASLYLAIDVCRRKLHRKLKKYGGHLPKHLRAAGEKIMAKLATVYDDSDDDESSLDSEHQEPRSPRSPRSSGSDAPRPRSDSCSVTSMSSWKKQQSSGSREEVSAQRREVRSPPLSPPPSRAAALLTQWSSEEEPSASSWQFDEALSSAAALAREQHTPTISQVQSPSRPSREGASSPQTELQDDGVSLPILENLDSRSDPETEGSSHSSKKGKKPAPSDPVSSSPPNSPDEKQRSEKRKHSKALHEKRDKSTASSAVPALPTFDETPVTSMLRRFGKSTTETLEQRPLSPFQGSIGRLRAISGMRREDSLLGTKTIDADNTAVHSAPATSSQVVARLASGQQLQVIQVIRCGRHRMWGRIGQPPGWIMLADPNGSSTNAFLGPDSPNKSFDSSGLSRSPPTSSPTRGII